MLELRTPINRAPAPAIPPPACARSRTPHPNFPPAPKPSQPPARKKLLAHPPENTITSRRPALIFIDGHNSPKFAPATREKNSAFVPLIATPHPPPPTQVLLLLHSKILLVYFYPTSGYTACIGGVGLVTVSNPRCFVTFLTLLNSSLAFAQSPALVRDATIATVQTLQGAVPAHVTPVIPSHNLTIVILADSLTAADATRLRREIAATFTTSFLNGHHLQLVNLSGLAGDFSTPLTTAAQLQAALKQIAPGSKATTPLSLIETLGAIPANLPSNWAHTVIAGHLPLFSKDETGRCLAQRSLPKAARASQFLVVDGAAPACAQSVAAGAMGTVATVAFNALLPMLNDNSAYAEVSWEIKFSQGAWPYSADLKNSTGERISTVASLAIAAGYTLPFRPYLSARASAADPQNVLSFNPADVNALRSLATQLTEQKQHKQAAVQWRSLSEIVPSDGSAWAALGETSYAFDAFEDASNALTRAAALGVKTPSTLELQGRLSIHQNDFAAALLPVEEASPLLPPSNLSGCCVRNVPAT